jgi:hypothetical protein
VTTFDLGEFGGAEIGGTAPVRFVHGAGQVGADVVVEWDFDNDGDFDQPEEDITGDVMSLETLTGRDWPSSLTGKAAPGQFKATLLNKTGKYGFFNAASPLTVAPFSLSTGRKLRVRTASAGNPDPVLLARDRFTGSGALGTDETGKVWTAQTTAPAIFTRQGDSSGATMAVPGVKADPGIDSVHLATLDVGTADTHLQARWRHLDWLNTVGLVYRFDDAANYGLVYVRGDDPAIIQHGSFTAGVFTANGTVLIEARDDDYLGLVVAGTNLTVLHNGVVIATGTAYSSSSHKVGMRANWRNQRAPAIHEFYAWNRRPAETEGILWTGTVAQVTPDVTVDGIPIVELTGDGPLITAAGAEISPPNSIGVASGYYAQDSAGSPSGRLVGSALARAGMLHPGWTIANGVVTCGSVGLERGDALAALRQYEETELGFLFEAQEGYVGFEGRGDRVGKSIDAWFSDAPGAQFGYSSIEPFDWRSQIVNAVESAVAPKLPKVVIYEAENTATGDVIIPMPTIGNGAEPGDLFLIVIASSISSSTEWTIPPGWTEYRNAKAQLGKVRVYAKVAGEDDIGDTVTFLNTGGSGGFTSYQIHVKDFYGDLNEGLAVSAFQGFGGSSVAKARIGLNDPQVVFPSWAPQPSAVLVFRAGMTGSSPAIDDTGDEWFAPDGFFELLTSHSNDNSTALQVAGVNTNAPVIDPSSFTDSAAFSAAFDNFDAIETVTIAIRGFTGDTPQVSGGQTVRTDDVASQTRHNMIRTHTVASNLFGSEADALAYNQAVLVTYADDRPIVKISFPATLSAAYRMQAVRRRLSDKIHLTANGATGLGIDADFFIESIGHQMSNAGKVWLCTWELSPA